MIEAHQLDCEIDGHRVLSHVSVRLTPGSMTVILGENGAGKSSLLRCLAGRIQPTHGHVRLNGRDLSSYRPDELARRRAVLLHDGAIHFPFTALEIVQLGRHPCRPQPPADERSPSEQALMLLGVHHLRQRIFSSLSGGERQRIQLARALVQIWQTENSCLLLDEPTSALDLKHQLRVLTIIRQLATQYRIMVVCVMHAIHLLSRFFDHVVLLKEGRVLAAGDAHTVLNVEHLERTYSTRIKCIKDEQGRNYFVNS